jgi:hypothetical protein
MSDQFRFQRDVKIDNYNLAWLEEDVEDGKSTKNTYTLPAIAFPSHYNTK